MEPIIKKAIEEGYRWNYKDRGHEVFGEKNTSTKYICSYAHICDPLFWQALGKACGWYSTKEYIEADGFLWLKNALRFHEINLTEGWDKAVEYLTEVTKNK